MAARWLGVALSFVVAVGAACAREASPTPSSAPLSAPSEEAETPTPAPSVAEVSCESPDRTSVSPIVAAQSDGIHFTVSNVTSETFGFVTLSLSDDGIDDGELASQGDTWIPPGTKELTFVLPPGPSGVVCLPEGDRLPEDRDGLNRLMAPFQVVDPEGMWVPIPSDLECGGVHVTTHEVYLPADSPDPGAVVRDRLVGIRDDDVLRRVGYPDQPHVRMQVERTGSIVALVDFGPAGNSGAVASCDDSGIEPEPLSPEPEPTVSHSPPSPEEFPEQAIPVEGGTYWALYLAVGDEGLRGVDEAIALAESWGYMPSVRTLGCDVGAAEDLELSADLTAVALYFEREFDAEWLADATDTPTWYPIEVTTTCLG